MDQATQLRQILCGPTGQNQQQPVKVTGTQISANYNEELLKNSLISADVGVKPRSPSPVLNVRLLEMTGQSRFPFLLPLSLFSGSLSSSFPPFVSSAATALRIWCNCFQVFAVIFVVFQIYTTEDCGHERAVEEAYQNTWTGVNSCAR